MVEYDLLLTLPPPLSHAQDASEYNELPVRHNEDSMNRSLVELLPLPVSPPDSYESPHTKTHLLLQAHFSHAPLPIADYATDTKSVLDQALRILQVKYVCVLLWTVDPVDSSRANAY